MLGDAPGFWPARRYISLAELDARYVTWRYRVCNQRLHASRRVPVAERLAEERRALTPPPPAHFDWSGHCGEGADRRLPAPRPLLLPRGG